jgi:hypothetical protein
VHLNLSSAKIKEVLCFEAQTKLTSEPSTDFQHLSTKCLSHADVVYANAKSDCTGVSQSWLQKGETLFITALAVIRSAAVVQNAAEPA